MAFTGDDLLASVKRGISVPSYQVRLTDADILELADEEVSTVFVPLLTSLRSEYFVTKTTTPVVADQRTYEIPYRAIGRNLRDIRWVSQTLRSSLKYIAPEDEEYFEATSSQRPYGFYFEGDKIVVVPTPTAANGDIELKYELRPSKITKVEDSSVVSAIDRNTGLITLESALSNLTTGDLVDFVGGKSGFASLGIDVETTNVAGTAITVATGDIPADLRVGDYMSLAGQSPVVQLPDEAHPVLAHAVQCRILRLQGDFEALGIEEQLLDKKRTLLRETLSPRITGESQVIINRNGLIRSSPRRRFL